MEPQFPHGDDDGSNSTLDALSLAAAVLADEKANNSKGDQDVAECQTCDEEGDGDDTFFHARWLLCLMANARRNREYSQKV